MIGSPPVSGRQIAAVFIVGVIGVLIPGLQPQLLGALAVEGRVSLAALGPLATVELIAMGVAAALAGAVLPAARLRAIASVALLATAGLDLATLHAAGGAAIFAARIGAGLGEGTLVWVAIGFIVRTAAPERWSGAYLAVQTLAQFAVASGLGAAAAASATGFAALAAITAAGLVAVPLLPRGYPALAPADAVAGGPAGRGALALAGVLLYLTCVVAVWVYVEPLGLARGVPAAWVRVIAPLSLAMQVLGAGAATLLADRIPPRATIVAVAAGNLVLIAVMAAVPSATAFVAASAAFGFLWLFAMPFQIPLVIAADPTRRAAQLIGGAQLAGSGAGPFAAGLIAGDQVTVVPWIGAGALVAGVALLLVASPRRA